MIGLLSDGDPRRLTASASRIGHDCQARGRNGFAAASLTTATDAGGTRLDLAGLKPKDSRPLAPRTAQGPEHDAAVRVRAARTPPGRLRGAATETRRVDSWSQAERTENDGRQHSSHLGQAGDARTEEPESLPAQVRCEDCCGGGGSVGGGAGCGGGNRCPSAVDLTTGEVRLSVPAIGAAGKALGHTLEFESRLDADVYFGNGFDWRIQQWPYLAITGDGCSISQVCVVGYKSKECPICFTGSNNVFTPMHNSRQSLALAGQKLVFTDADGTQIWFWKTTGVFEKILWPSKETIWATLAKNGYSFKEVVRKPAAESQTLTEKITYTYDDESSCDPKIQSVVLSAGSDGETDLLKAEMSYYGEDEAYGSENDLKTVGAKVWEDGQWQAAGTTYFRYYKTLEGSGSSSSSGGGQPRTWSSTCWGPWPTSGWPTIRRCRTRSRPATLRRPNTPTTISSTTSSGG